MMDKFIMLILTLGSIALGVMVGLVLAPKLDYPFLKYEWTCISQKPTADADGKKANNGKQ